MSSLVAIGHRSTMSKSGLSVAATHSGVRFPFRQPFTALFYYLVLICLTVLPAIVRADDKTSDTHAGAPIFHGAIGVGSWNTVVEYKDIVVTSNDVVLYRSDFAGAQTNGWSLFNGNWGVQDGVLQQTSAGPDCRAVIGSTNWSNYTITLRARKIRGDEGFLILFNWLNDANVFWFNIGRWGEYACVEQISDGRSSIIGRSVNQTVATNVWYDIRVAVTGTGIECYINNHLVEAMAYVDGNLLFQTGANQLTASPNALQGGIGVGTRNTSVEYRNITVESNNTVLYHSDFDTAEGTNGWRFLDGGWSVEDGALQQTEPHGNCLATVGDATWANYTLTLQARKIDGGQGFRIYFNWLDATNWFCFAAGGWGNSFSGIQQSIDGVVIDSKLSPQTIEPKVWYNIRVVSLGPRIECYVNERLVAVSTCINRKVATDVPLPPVGAAPIRSASTVAAMTGTDAVKGYAVHAEGIVIIADPASGTVLFKDDGGSMPIAIDLSKIPVKPGTSVILDGKTSAELIRYPDHPSGHQYLTSFEAPINVDDLYLARVRGFLHPPRTGDYTFWISSDNGSELWLSPDDDPKHIRKIATVADAYAYTPYHGWDVTPRQKSAPIHLEAGRKYYIEALHAEQTGEDFLSVAWQGPDISRSVIDGTFLSPPPGEHDRSGDKCGSILREYWLNYPFNSPAEAQLWANSVGITVGKDIESMLKNAPTHYGKPQIIEAHLTPTKSDLPAPRPAKVKQPWPEQSDYDWVEIIGVITQIAAVDDYWSVLKLSDQGRQMTVRLPNPGHEKLEGWMNARVKIHGFCEGALAGNDERLAAVLWVPGIADVELVPPANEDWIRLPRTSVHDLNSTNRVAQIGRRIKIVGECREVRPGELLVRDSVSLLSAYISTNGIDWNPVGGVIEMPMKYSVYSGIATYAAASTNLCTATYDHVSASLFPALQMEIGNPPVTGNTHGDSSNVVATGTGEIGGRAGVDVLRNDEFDFFYKQLDGDGELVARMASIDFPDNTDAGAGSGLMIRETFNGNSRMVFLAVSTMTGVDLRVRRSPGSPIAGFPYGQTPPCWLKLVRQSGAPMVIHCSQTPKLALGEFVEAMGILGNTNHEWTLTDAFCRLPPSTAGGSNPAVQSADEINSIQQIRQMGPDELKLGRTARIDAVITAKTDEVYVQDDTGGIRIPADAAQKFNGLEVGQRVSIIGSYALKGSPVLEPRQQADSVTLLGAGCMPQPVPCTRSHLMSSQQDAQWVEVRGVVRKIEGHTLKLQMPGGTILADLNFDLPLNRSRGLIDSTIRIEGVCNASINGKTQSTGAQLIVPKPEFIIVDEPSPADPFAVAASPINRLLQFRDEADLVHRVKIEGVVTYCHNGISYIQDETGGIEVAAGEITFQPGDRVEVLGFPASNGSTVDLADALARKTSGGTLPEPVKLTSLPQPEHASRLVSMDAVFLGHSELLDNDVAQLQSGDRIFQALLPKDSGTLTKLELGSRVRLKGVCRTVQSSTGKSAGEDFELLLSSPNDVVLLQAPPWWNWQRLLWIGGAFLGVVAISGAWIAMTLRKNRLLKTAHQDLQKANDELEMRVERRTAALAKSNAELTYEQSLLRTLLDNSSDYIYFKDANSHFVRCSLSMCNRSGLTHEQMVGKTDFDIFHEDHARPAFENEKEIIRTGQPLIGKLEKEVYPDGRITWAMTTKMPWRDAAGKIIGTFGISRDITSLKEAEARLEQVHQQLVDTSRAAGQAEVAASVLHNVGNVLNSVNVAAGIIHSQVRASKVAINVSRVAELLMQHQHDLAVFISQDERGSKLLPYLKTLGNHIATEQADLLQEIDSLAKNIEHIKEIVAMQQNYARVSGVAEIESVPALLEDAVRVHATALEAQQVRVVRQFDPVPEIVVDKHRVLQILVNLISNAKWALLESSAQERVLTLGIRRKNENTLLISVADNGVGISSENLKCLFRHGFTTRPDGHGFGLHSSILAAHQMGGDLVAESDGTGRGAVFTLELPCNPPKK